MARSGSLNNFGGYKILTLTLTLTHYLIKFHVLTLKTPWIVINLFVTSIWSFIRNFFKYFWNTFSINGFLINCSCSWCQNYPKFQNKLLRPPAVYIPNLNFIHIFFLYSANFGLISLIIHENDVITSYVPKKVCVSQT